MGCTQIGDRAAAVLEQNTRVELLELKATRWPMPRTFLLQQLRLTL